MTEPDYTAGREHARALEKEYGQYVATTSIYHDGALAYRPGDPVPATNVKAHGYDGDGLVVKSTTKAAAKAAEQEK